MDVKTPVNTILDSLLKLTRVSSNSAIKVEKHDEGLLAGFSAVCEEVQNCGGALDTEDDAENEAKKQERYQKALSLCSIPTNVELQEPRQDLLRRLRSEDCSKKTESKKGRQKKDKRNCKKCSASTRSEAHVLIDKLPGSVRRTDSESNKSKVGDGSDPNDFDFTFLQTGKSEHTVFSKEDVNKDATERLTFEGMFVTHYEELPEGEKKEEEETFNKCLLCDITFDDHTSLRTHCTQQHNTNKQQCKLRCRKCDSSYSTIACYVLHKAQVHPDDPCICVLCGVMVGSNSSLTRHLKTHFLPPDESKLHVCNVCGKVFLQKASLEYHLQDHSNSQSFPFQCKICNAKFKVKRSLTRHMRNIHLGERVECGDCKKSFSSQSALYHHQRTIHHNVSFHCGFCSKVFKSVSSARKHEGLMHQANPNKNASATEKRYSYNQYVSKVTGKARKNRINVIKCMHCDTKYTDQEAYEQHFSKFHRNEAMI